MQGSSTADDLAQEVFVRVVRSAETYDDRERERAWVFRIARSVLVDHQRRRNRTPQGTGPIDRAVASPQAVALDLQQALDAV